MGLKYGVDQFGNSAQNHAQNQKIMQKLMEGRTKDSTWNLFADQIQDRRTDGRWTDHGAKSISEEKKLYFGRKKLTTHPCVLRAIKRDSRQ